ncbi:DUF7093 family protein [Halorubrum sp. DTA46]|uniref:DUF7093 family protein n=1 Tax=Halorubrum sp. DTA46 TaxID=3402162 RepID=UPI003AAA8DCE
MGLRCLLGHDFDEPELQREREEDGSEVVTTVTEVKTCARCGETQIVSENTEVTTMEQLADEATAIGADDGDDERGLTIDDERGPTVDDQTADATAGTGDVEAGDATVDDATVDDATADDAIILDDEPVDATASAEGGNIDDNSSDDGSGDTDPAAASANEDAELLDESTDESADDGGLGGDYEEYPDVETADQAANPEERAETDDGVILDESETTDEDRERGAWPEVDEEEAPGSEPTPWPEQAGEDEGYSAEVTNGDGAGGVEFGGGLTPEVDDAAVDGDPEFVEGTDGSDERVENAWSTGSGRDGAASESDADVGEAGGTDTGRDEGVEITHGESPALTRSMSDVTTEYYCPECEMTRSAAGNSMRAGDICPECKRGYVSERPR